MEETLHRGVDAPMSNFAGCVGQIGQDQRIQFPDDIAFKTALYFFGGETFGGTPRHVSTSPRIAAHTNERDGPKCIVRTAVPASIEAMTIGFSGRCLQRTCSAERCHGGFAA